MAAGVPHLRGLQQHYEKEQGALHHDRSGGAEAEKAQEEKLKNRSRGSILRVGKCSPYEDHTVGAPSYQRRFGQHRCKGSKQDASAGAAHHKMGTGAA